MSFIHVLIKTLVQKFSPIWVFGSFAKTNFFHNSKAFFLYCHEYKKVKPIWITINDNLITDLRKEGFYAYHKRSLIGRIVCILAKYHITDWGIDDINKKYSKYSKHINLWHGVPIKSIGLDVKTNYKASINSFGIPYMVTACSKFDKDRLSSAFNLNKSSIKITGLTRNDWIYNKIKPTNQDKEFIDYISKFKDTTQKIMLYLPTFDDSQESNQFEWINAEFQEYLKKKNYIFFIKRHIADQSSIYSDSFNNIIDLDANCDLYPALNLFDLLITDYSSIVFDFALTNQRIIHYVPNSEHFKTKVRNMYLDITLDENAAGDVCNNFEDLLKSIESGENKSKMINDKYNKYKSGSCKRVYDLLN